MGQVLETAPDDALALIAGQMPAPMDLQRARIVYNQPLRGEALAGILHEVADVQHDPDTAEREPPRPVAHINQHPRATIGALFLSLAGVVANVEAGFEGLTPTQAAARAAVTVGVPYLFHKVTSKLESDPVIEAKG